MSAKVTLIKRITAFEETLLLPQLINESAGDTPHNRSAALLRKGLGIVIFNILEDFIKERTVEMFTSVSSSLTSFSYLPKELQEAATLGALRGLSNKAALEKKAQGNWLGLIHTESMNINSTSQVNGFTISPFSLMSEGSNIYAEDIPKAMKCLNIDGGWDTLQKISTLVNGGIPDLKQSYINISTRRHRAAHVASFDYEHGWLKDAINEIFAIALSFDIALTCRCRELHSKPAVALMKSSIVSSLSCRFLIHNAQKNHFSEKISLTAKKSVKNWSDIGAAIQNIAPKCLTNNEYLIVLNSQSRITNWYCG